MAVVLIHGAWHGGWCWEHVVRELDARGLRALAPDLPGHGDDPTPAKEVTLETYVARVCSHLDREIEPVVLVGHSMGGLVITQVAEERPEKVAALVYLAAFLPPIGESSAAARIEDTDSLLIGKVQPSADGATLELPLASVREIFYADSPAEDVERARARLCPQSAAVFRATLRTTQARFGRVPRYYIECLRDRALPPALQRRFYTATPCARVLSLDTDHSPFFSAPKELAEHILALAR